MKRYYVVNCPDDTDCGRRFAAERGDRCGRQQNNVQELHDGSCESLSWIEPLDGHRKRLPLAGLMYAQSALEIMEVMEIREGIIGGF